MQYLPLTLETPARNLALDEALLDAAETGETNGRVLRVWEPTQHFVVLGRSSIAKKEVNLAACSQERVSVLRRSSGGGTIVAGPGCLMYAVVLSTESAPHLRMVDSAHRFVLERMAEVFSGVPNLSMSREGISDLVLHSTESARATGHAKCSGNALRCKRNHLLYHGTLLYDFQLDRIARLLGIPQRQPDYRANRGHSDFVTNLPLQRDTLIDVLRDCWDAHTPLKQWPEQRVAQLVRDRYDGNEDWMIFDADKPHYQK